MSQLEILRSNIARLFDAYCTATGASPSAVSVAVSNDNKFVKTFRERDMRVGTYDLVVSRFSAIWPEGAAWPDGVDRPAPAVDAQAPARGRLQPTIHPEWPEGVPWPADIPKPETVNSQS